jgi:DNA-binding transcriptional LysR family regulator
VTTNMMGLRWLGLGNGENMAAAKECGQCIAPILNMHVVHIKSLPAVDLNLLVVLQALLAERNVTRAAARLALSQSATSHALARLRDLYGDPLLVRSGRRLDLTPRAVALLPMLERGLGDLERTLTGEPAFDPGTARRSFTVAMADYSQAVSLGTLLARLRSEAPGIALQVVAFPMGLEMLESGGADLAVLVRDPPPPGFSRARLFSDGFISMIRREHPRVPARRRQLPLATFLALDHLVVSPAGSPGSLIDTELERRGLRRRIAAHVSSFLVAPLVVSQSDLVSTGPERLLRRMAPYFPVRLLAPPIRLPRFDLDLVWHARRDHDPAHSWLRRLIIEVSAG